MLRTLLILVLLQTVDALAQTQLPAFFSDYMVLQQNKEVSIWGSDTSNTEIKIDGSWGATATTTTTSKGTWKTRLKTPIAGGPYTITIQGSKKVSLNEVMIGEVWFCAGQSNMDMPIKGFTNQGVKGSLEAILNSKNDVIRLFHTRRTASLKPLEDVQGNWTIASPNTVQNFSAVAYFFAKKMQETLNVPIGIIHSSWGGSTIEAWMDKETLSSFDAISLPKMIPEDVKTKRKSPTLLYNGMLNPYIGYGIKGFLWYQGESNRKYPKAYSKLFPAMITNIRSKWLDEKLPFYFVQIAPYGKNTGTNAAFFREAQLQTMQNMEHTGMVVTLDIGDCTSIHPQNKKTVGNRLAYWALSRNYGYRAITPSGPLYQTMETLDTGEIKVFFEYTANGLTSFDKPLTGFEVAGNDGVFYPAKAMINKDKTITVWSDKVAVSLAARYAFKNCVPGTLFNTSGLPASSFRTDNWNK